MLVNFLVINMKKVLKKKFAKKGDSNKEKMRKVIASITMETDGNICGFYAKGGRCDVLNLLASVMISNEGFNQLHSEVMPIVMKKKLGELFDSIERHIEKNEGKPTKKVAKKKVVSKKKK